MKKLTTIVIAAIVFLTSCAHNFGALGIGTEWKAAAAQYGLSYGDGLFATFVTKDGVKFRAELDSTMGFSYDPVSNTFKGIRAIEYSLPPQITGYAVDFARDNPEVAKAYYNALIKYYENDSKKEANQQPLVSDEKSAKASSSIADVIKTALNKVMPAKDNEPFTCNGDCEIELSKNHSISYQKSAATKLLTYADDETKFEGETQTLKHSLESFLTRLDKLLARGRSVTQMRIKAATIKNGKLKYIRYIMTEPDGDEFETNCPECVLEDE